MILTRSNIQAPVLIRQDHRRGDGSTDFTDRLRLSVIASMMSAIPRPYLIGDFIEVGTIGPPVAHRSRAGYCLWAYSRHEPFARQYAGEVGPGSGNPVRAETVTPGASLVNRLARLASFAPLARLTGTTECPAENSVVTGMYLEIASLFRHPILPLARLRLIYRPDDTSTLPWSSTN